MSIVIVIDVAKVMEMAGVTHNSDRSVRLRIDEKADATRMTEK